MMDRLLRAEIVAEVRKAIRSENRHYVLGRTLCRHVESLTPEWLERNGSSLNRTKLKWTDRNGQTHESREWLYPLEEILDMVEDGRIQQLVVR
jgi:hypothetical protein